MGRKWMRHLYQWGWCWTEIKRKRGWRWKEEVHWIIISRIQRKVQSSFNWLKKTLRIFIRKILINRWDSFLIPLVGNESKLFFVQYFDSYSFHLRHFNFFVGDIFNRKNKEVGREWIEWVRGWMQPVGSFSSSWLSPSLFWWNLKDWT